MGPEASVWARAARQHGVVSRRQVLADGLSVRQLDLRVATGRLEVFHRGVYSIAGAPVSFEQSLMAACLAGGGLASHRSAAALWDLRGCHAGPVEITVAGRRRPELTGVVAHTTDRLDVIDAAERLGIPVTSPARTLLDLGSVVPAEVVESALEDALLRRLVGLPFLRRTVRRLGRPGRNGSGVLRRLLEERDPATAPTESELEDRLLRLLLRAGLRSPVRQHRVATPGGRSVRLDFAYPDLRLGIEADSRTWHSGRADVQRNSAKGNALVATGWRMLHFTSADVDRRPAEVVAAVARELGPPFAASAPLPAS